MIVYILAGILFFVLATGFLSHTSESALMDGSFGIVIGILGALGAFIGKKSAGMAIVMSLAFAVGGAGLLGLFFVTIWPML